MPDMFTGSEFSVEMRFVNEPGRVVRLKNLDRTVYIYTRVSYDGRDTDWKQFGDPLPYITDTSHQLYGAFVHDVYHFALAESARWSPVVRDGLFGVEGQWKGPDIGMLMEEAIVFNEWEPKERRGSIEWCHGMAVRGGAECSHRDLRRALDHGRQEWESALRQFTRHGVSQHAFGIRMINPDLRYGSGRLTGIGAGYRQPDL